MLWISFLFLFLFASPAHAVLDVEQLLDNVNDLANGFWDVKTNGVDGRSPKPPSVCCAPALGTPTWTAATTNAGVSLGDRHSVNILANPARAGTGAVKFILKGSDQGWAYNGYKNPYFRTELEHDFGPVVGKTACYGASFYVHPGWTDTSDLASNEGNAAFMQWHQNPNTGDACDINAGPPGLFLYNHKSGTCYYRAETQRTDGTPPTCGATQVAFYPFDCSTAVGNWMDLQFKIKWAFNGTGSLVVKKDGVVVINETNIDTTQDNTDDSQNFKMGIYRAPWKDETASVDTDQIAVSIDQLRVVEPCTDIDDVDPAQGIVPPVAPSDITFYGLAGGTPATNSWENVPSHTLTAAANCNSGVCTNNADLSAGVQGLYDSNNIYIRYAVQDANLVADSGTNYAHDDSVVTWIRKDGDAASQIRPVTVYNDTDAMLAGTCAGYLSTVNTITGGYEVIATIPRTCFGSPTLAAGLHLDFIPQINDDDSADAGGADRQGRLADPVTPESITFDSTLDLVLSSTTYDLSAAAARPTVSSFTSSGVSITTATVTFSTNELTTTKISCGTALGGPYGTDYPTVADTVVDNTVHSLSLTGLTPATTYYCVAKPANQATLIPDPLTEINFTTSAPAALDVIGGRKLTGGGIFK